jgi:uncharacterized membrane protein
MNNRKIALSRRLISIIGRNSNWTKTGIGNALAANVYAGRKSWQRFLDVFLLSAGVGFTASGVIFFFAYNWEEIPPFAKMGIISALFAGCALTAVFAGLPKTAKNTILTGAALLAGALFAVFGQIYQTGANSWELFAVWTACITVWVFAADFIPLWILFMSLVNTAFVLYAIYSNLDYDLILGICFLINSVFAIVWEILVCTGIQKQRERWHLPIVSLTAAIAATAGFIMFIVDKVQSVSGFIMLIMAAPVYCIGVMYSLKKHYTAYLLIIAVSVIAIFTTLIIDNIKEKVIAVFIAGLFVLGSVAIISSIVYKLNKNRHNNNEKD